jgi:hypothetical protein
MQATEEETAYRDQVKCAEVAGINVRVTGFQGAVDRRLARLGFSPPRSLWVAEIRLWITLALDRFITMNLYVKNY